MARVCPALYRRHYGVPKLFCGCYRRLQTQVLWELLFGRARRHPRLAFWWLNTARSMRLSRPDRVGLHRLRGCTTTGTGTSPRLGQMDPRRAIRRAELGQD